MELFVMAEKVRSSAWTRTPDGAERGSIECRRLEEVWFHTGSACNLSCPSCLEGSRPGDDRVGLLRFDEARPFIDEALKLGVRQFSFTGGEPFVAKDLILILDYALRFRPCLVLTNGTDPLIRRAGEILPLKNAPHPLSFRISLDHYDPKVHDRERGQGMLKRALEGLHILKDAGFHVSIACRMTDETFEVRASGFERLLLSEGLPGEIPRIEFPELHPPGTAVSTPQISQSCMESYPTEASRKSFMCSKSRMVTKVAGQVRVYACTLVDDDSDFDMGATLAESLAEPVRLKHHRCYSCFSCGSSCSELADTDGSAEEKAYE